MTDIYKLMILVASIVYIMNYSGILYSITKSIYRLINPKKEYLGQQLPKPFSCAMCMSFWIVLILCWSKFGWIYAIGIASIGSIYSLIVDVILKFIIDKINRLK